MIREFQLTEEGITIGEPIDLQALLQ